MITDPFANNPPKFKPAATVTETAAIYLGVVAVEENRRAFALPDAIDAGRVYPRFTPTSSALPFPVGAAEQPGIPGTVGLPIRIVSR